MTSDAAVLRRDVAKLEVLDVDAGRAERLRDACEHARLVGNAHADAVQHASLGAVGVLEHPAAHARPPRRSSARRSARSPFRSACSTSPISSRWADERVGDQVAVLDEDVGPHHRVRAGDARHLAERRACVPERFVSRGGDALHQQVRERVREVARQREHAVVRLGVELDRARAERCDEALDELDARRRRSQEAA